MAHQIRCELIKNNPGWCADLPPLLRDIYDIVASMQIELVRQVAEATIVRHPSSTHDFTLNTQNAEIGCSVVVNCNAAKRKRMKEEAKLENTTEPEIVFAGESMEPVHAAYRRTMPESILSQTTAKYTKSSESVDARTVLQSSDPDVTINILNADRSVRKQSLSPANSNKKDR